MTKQIAAHTLATTLIEAAQAWRIEVFAEDLNKKNQWGLDAGAALSLYLAKKHNWTIPHCRSLSFQDLSVALREEMRAFQFPKHLLPVDRALELTLTELHKIGESQS
ncbi:MAG: hypothetical protein ABSG59_23520 [Verrucomicrobiota bacterium]|jgi:hypothetical protein